MSKRRGVQTRWVPREKKGRRRSASPLARTRRQFVKDVGAAAILLGAQPLTPGAFASGRTAAGMEERTLFFNFSRIRTMSKHYLYLAGRKYRLTPVSEQPDVLAFERRRNEFLRAVPDDKITHHVQGALVPLDAVTLGYSTCDENTGDGTWAMTSMFFTIPKSSVSQSYAHARTLTPLGPLPLSGKRERYKTRPAFTQQDLEEELSLMDTTTHAEALVGLHPEILSVEPNSGAKIQHTYVSPDSATKQLGGLLEQLGPATTQDANDSGGWATLNLLGIDPDTKKPFKKSDGLLNQYYPDWAPVVDQFWGPAMISVHPKVKNDETLGSDLTGYNLNDPNTPIPPEKFTGKMWARRDGVASVDQSVTRLGGPGPKVAFSGPKTHPGLQLGDLSTSDVTILQDGRVQVTLDNVSNWFLRWLGVWVQFLGPDTSGPDGGVISAKDLPDDTIFSDDPGEKGPYPRANTDLDDALFLGVVPNPFSVAGIPIYPPGRFAPTIRIPTSAATMRLFYTGIGQSGSRPSTPTGIYGAGIAMTTFFNYGVVGLFMASGASGYEATFQLAEKIGVRLVAAEIQALTTVDLNDPSIFKGLLTFAMGILKVLLQAATSQALTIIITAIKLVLYFAQIADSFPVVGQIARAVAAGIGLVQLAETSIEVACSPAAYVFDVVETHDLTINIQPDIKDTQFPDPPNGFTLYYKVSYLFDNGAAHVRDLVDVLDPTVKPIIIKFPGIPRGGMVNIKIGFYMRHQRAQAGMNDWCAAMGETGLFPNIADQAPDLTVSQTKVAIQPTTQYLHKRKTALDSQASHFWNFEAPPPVYVPPPRATTPSLGDFRSITVRQGTSKPPHQGFVGYAWEALSTGVQGCGSGGQGQFDQVANLNTDAGNQGRNAQNGYTNSVKSGVCGLDVGVRVGYNLLSDDSMNLYLDTTTLHLRPVTLGSVPAFANKSSNQSFGQLNMPSTRCLLHPAGHIVSISAQNNKIEVLKLPREVQTDTAASSFFLARTLSGKGSRPGLITSPVAAVISPDGVILVLEAGGEKDNNRIQAFDLGGNPVLFFKGQTEPYFLELTETKGFTYLDVAVEFTGYLYVLSKDTNNAHRLDIYHPAQTNTLPICTTANVNAAKLAVDFWRSVYTLNYEVLQLPGGGGIPAFTEPSVSLWLPTPPNENLGRRDPRLFVPRK